MIDRPAPESFAASAKPVSGKAYRLTVTVPDELIGEPEAAAEKA